MTMAVRDAIRDGRFQDAARMERLDVAFATRYLTSRDQYFAGELQGQSWLQAYEAATREQYTVLQQLLIAINPHVMVDLGVAAARTCPGPAIAGLEQDFNTINTVIASLFPVIDAELDELSPFEDRVDHSFFGCIKDDAIRQAIDEGRKSSWAFAVSLAGLALPAQTSSSASAIAMAAARRLHPSRSAGLDCEEAREHRCPIEHTILNAPAAATASPQTPQTSSPPR